MLIQLNFELVINKIMEQDRNLKTNVPVVNIISSFNRVNSAPVKCCLGGVYILSCIWVHQKFR